MSNYDEVRYSIYNRLDALPQLQRDAIVKRIGWLEKIIEQRERTYHLMADYLEALNEDAERQEQEYGPG